MSDTARCRDLPPELKQIRNTLKRAVARESENREGLTLVETLVILGALVAFASIYA
ncbi:uncharacterized protein METZ01_LOCUS101846 [marine metagenome]|uniref:Prepilin-type N-terminal cleavage/methylation domain-containing protein n=1 Tax=marine metagenome TaxID=408172 RepID=A0A381W944_9ZZZZ